MIALEEFSKYYWYRKELQQICKSLGIDYNGEKRELNHNIEEYFKGNIVEKKKSSKKRKAITEELTLETKLLDCGFCFNQKFRDFFSSQTGLVNFKFNTDMVATAKKVKETQDEEFTLGDLLDIYYGKKEYAKFDKSSCEWNQFLKGFCEDKENSVYSNKLKVASILWNKIKNSTRKKVYTKTLTQEYSHLIEVYKKN